MRVDANFEAGRVVIQGRTALFDFWSSVWNLFSTRSVLAHFKY